MKNKLYKWWNRKWSDWTTYSMDRYYDINRNTDWRIVTTMIRTSNDGLIEYKHVKNF